MGERIASGGLATGAQGVGGLAVGPGVRFRVQSTTKRPCLARVVLVLLLPTALGAGCYERVVRANGIGSTNTAVQDGYRSNTAADRAVDRIIATPQTTPRAQRWVDPESNARGDR